MNNSGQEQKQHNKERNDNSNLYLTDNSTLQTPEEALPDKHKHNREAEDRIESNTTHDVEADHLAGSDRAGTNERKP